MVAARLFVLGACLALACGSAGKVAKLAAIGDSRELRTGSGEGGAKPVRRPAILILGIDGMKRDVLYRLLQDGELPGLAALLGGRENGEFPHAHFDRSMIAPFPSVTLVGWGSIFSGEKPAVSGITGNEIFIREERRLAAPIPGSFEAKEPVLATYTDDYANRLLQVPTVYERLREKEPGISIWVSVGQFYRGADRLLVAPRSALIDMFSAVIKDVADGKAYSIFEQRDRDVLETVIDEIEDDDRPVPDVLTVYVSGTDAYAHAAAEGPDRALRRFMTGKLDGMLGRLARSLDERGELADRYVVLVSDHGHSQVPGDGSTLLSNGAENDPAAVLTAAGFRVRPFQLDVTDDADFQSVLAYQGPVAYLYLADRSRCRKKGTACDWRRPPRFREDVLAAAQAYYDANRTGRHVPKMKGTLEMILTRRPRPFAENDLPFEVYAGNGRVVPVGRYLAKHPMPRWLDFESRLRDLAVGRYGERAGDVILIARGGDDDGPEGRFYFNSSAQKSIHGSASRQDGEVAMILAHPGKSAAQLKTIASEVLGARSRSRQVTDLVLRLRSSEN